MMFGKNKVNLKTLKEQDPDAYNELVSEIKGEVNGQESEALVAAKTKIEELTTKVGRDALVAKISNYAEKLKVKAVGDEAIKENLDFDAAMIKMVDAHIEKTKDILESFVDTASAAAGVNTGEDDSTEVEPKNFGQAIKLIIERDKITPKEAADKAKVEYKELFNNMYPEKEE